MRMTTMTDRQLAGNRAAFARTLRRPSYVAAGAMAGVLLIAGAVMVAQEPQGRGRGAAESLPRPIRSDNR